MHSELSVGSSGRERGKKEKWTRAGRSSGLFAYSNWLGLACLPACFGRHCVNWKQAFFDNKEEGNNDRTIQHNVATTTTKQMSAVEVKKGSGTVAGIANSPDVFYDIFSFACLLLEQRPLPVYSGTLQSPQKCFTHVCALYARTRCMWSATAYSYAAHTRTQRKQSW